MWSISPTTPTFNNVIMKSLRAVLSSVLPLQFPVTRAYLVKVIRVRFILHVVRFGLHVFNNNKPYYNNKNLIVIVKRRMIISTERSTFM